MPDAINTTVAATGNAPRAVAPSAPAPKPAGTSASASPQIQRISPAIRFDPGAGVMITEYFDGNGKVQTQIPSAASIAYMRVGLTANGEPYKEAEAQEKPPAVLA
jgi:hypothetical protein